jgi:hypothetical protein
VTQHYGAAVGRGWTQVRPAASELVHNATNFHTKLTEAQQQCQTQAGSFHIVHALCDVDAVEDSHSVEFDDHAVIKQEIHGSQAILPGFVRRAILIDLFQRAWRHNVQGGEGEAADWLSSGL